ncbi:hypothetical protein quinque_004950 [Culex quinquefasciatus]
MVQGNKDFNVRLITLVKAHPIIWNRNDQHYRSTRNRRENHLVEIWKHIASEIGQGTMEEEDSEGSGSEPTGAKTFRQCKHLVVDSQNTDAVFLLSLLPDLGRMGPAQKRLFKRGGAPRGCAS